MPNAVLKPGKSDRDQFAVDMHIPDEDVFSVVEDGAASNIVVGASLPDATLRSLHDPRRHALERYLQLLESSCVESYAS